MMKDDNSLPERLNIHDRSWIRSQVEWQNHIPWVYYLNNEMGYGYDDEFIGYFLLDMEPLTNHIRRVISKHETFEDMRLAFLHEQEVRQAII